MEAVFFQLQYTVLVQTNYVLGFIDYMNIQSLYYYKFEPNDLVQSEFNLHIIAAYCLFLRVSRSRYPSLSPPTVPNRFFWMRYLAYLKAGNYSETGERGGANFLIAV